MSHAMAFVVLAGCWTGDPPAPPTKPERPWRPAIAQLTPAGLDNVWLGMSFEDLQVARPKAKRSEGSYPHDPEIIFVEKNPAPGLTHATYIITKHGKQIVYQIGATYRDPLESQRLLATVYAPRGKVFPKHFDDEKMSEQIRIRGHAFVVGAWTYAEGLHVAGAVVGSPYEDGEFQKP